MFADETVQNALANYATEHFEIACYRALSEAAHTARQEHVAQVCGENLRDEQEMADWLSGQLPKIVCDASAKTATTRSEMGGVLPPIHLSFEPRLHAFVVRARTAMLLGKAVGAVVALRGRICRRVGRRRLGLSARRC